ncbi:hypothetical protein DRQ09_08205, partial [candidate division KSB1 bacterium]
MSIFLRKVSKYFKEKTELKIFIFFFLFYVLFMSGHMGGDSLWVYLTTESIVFDGNLQLNDHPGKEFQVKELAGKVEKIYNRGHEPGNESKVYSTFGLGLVLFQLPFFIFGYIVSFIIKSLPRDYILLFFTSITNCFVSALLCMVFYKLCSFFNFSKKVNFWLVLTFGLSTLVFPYSRQGFTEPLMCLSTLTSIYLILHYHRNKNLKYIVFSGLLLGFS